MQDPQQTGRDQVLVVALDGQRYAFNLKAVDRVIRAVAVTPVPETPASVLGLINLAGQLVPVVSLRSCLGLPDRAIRPEDQFVLVRTSRLTMALVVDEVHGLKALAVGQTVAPGDVLPAGEYRVHGLAKLKGDVLLIYDLDELFSPDDQERLHQVKGTAEA